MNTDTMVIGVCRLDGDGEERAKTLASALGLTVLEARSRVRPPAPRVVATFRNPQEASAKSQLLADGGFQPVVLDANAVKQLAHGVNVRHFELLPDGIALETRANHRYFVENATMRQFLAGMSSTTQLQTETTTTRKFSMGKAVMSGGLLLRTKKKVETTTVQHDAESFLLLHASSHPPFLLREKELVYQGLGAALQPSRLLNFQRLVQELRQRAPNAHFDDRLTSTGGQVNVLGGLLPNDQFLDVAMALLVACHVGLPAA